MASMWSVAKFLAISRGRTGSWRVNSSDSVTLAGDKEIAKIPGSPPAPVTSELVPDKPEPESQSTEVSPPQLASRTQSEAVSSAPTENFKTPPEETPQQSTWTGDKNDTVVHEPEESHSFETKVESEALSEGKRSAPPSVHDESDLQTSIQREEEEPSSLEAEQKDNNSEKLSETGDVLEASPAEETLPVDVPTHAEPQEQEPDSTQTDLKAASLEEEAITDDNGHLQEEPRHALDAVDDKSEAVDRLSDEVRRLREEIRVVTRGKEEALQRGEKERVEMVERMRVEMQDVRRASRENEEVAKKETQRVKGLIAVERHSHGERMKEFEQENDELNEGLEAAKKEIQRIKALIAVERHSHSERLKQQTEKFTAALEVAKKETVRVKSMIAVERHSHIERVREFRQEKEELVAALEAAQSNVLASEAELESQKEQIQSLEGGLDDSREQTRELYSKYQEQERTMNRLQEEIVEERDKVLMKDNQMQSQKAISHTLSTTLVGLQANANKTERHNRMLLEQVRQQSDQLQNRQYTDAYAGLGYIAANTLSAFSNLTRGIRRGAATARADPALRMLKQLNDEAFQLAATLTDQLEGVDKRFVSDDSPFFSGSEHHESNGVRLAKAEYLKSTLGLELINRLAKDAAYPMRDINPFFVQVALQGCLVACCMRIITSWYPNEWEYGKFLEVLYNRIKGTGGLDTALNWRKTTQQNCAPSTTRDRNSKLVDYLKEELRAVLSVSGWSSESDAEVLLESLREKLLNLVSFSLRLNTMTASGVPGEMEPILVERGSLFDWREMGDDTTRDRSRRSDLIPKEETVLCAVALGLRWSDGSDVDMPRLMLKPRVILNSVVGI